MANTRSKICFRVLLHVGASGGYIFCLNPLYYFLYRGNALGINVYGVYFGLGVHIGHVDSVLAKTGA